MTKRERRMCVKSMLLDTLVNDLSMVEFQEGEEHCYGLTADESYVVKDALADQLYAWAVRITPPGEAD